MQNIDLPGDSADYHLITKGIELSKDAEGLTCEIGLRRGGGTKTIIDALAIHAPHKTHIAIDPYGHIEYEHKEADFVRLDYTNDMYNDCMTNVFQYAKEKKIAFQFFKLEDTEFFMRYAGGVPCYDLVKKTETKYSFVHFDGPHAAAPLYEEIDFFMNSRTIKGSCWCFDDVTGYYNHDLIEKYLFKNGFVLIEKTSKKALYQYAGN